MNEYITISITLLCIILGVFGYLYRLEKKIDTLTVLFKNFNENDKYTNHTSDTQTDN